MMPMLISLALAFPGFVALSLGMDRHQEDLLGKTLQRPGLVAWRCIGMIGLVLALVVCMQAWSISVGVAVWLGLLTFAAMMVGLLLTYAPHLLFRLAGWSAGLGVVLWLCQLL